jgi:hypothetical protein
MLSKKPKEEYWKRRKEVRTTLIGWGIKQELVSDIDREHSVGVLEKVIEATKGRNPKDSARYFLNGLNYSRIKHGRSPLSVSFLKKNNNKS